MGPGGAPGVIPWRARFSTPGCAWEEMPTLEWSEREMEGGRERGIFESQKAAMQR